MATRVLLLGAGTVGIAITHLLANAGDYELVVGDDDDGRLDLVDRDDVRKQRIDARDPAALGAALRGMDVVISACPFFLSVPIAEAARQAGVNYFDMTEDVETTRRIKQLANGAGTVFMPQCGLAPGFIAIAAYELSKKFDTLRRVRMRVGALPKFSSNALKYNLTWSIDGLINEYLNPCQVIYDGEPREVLPLEGHEQFTMDGVNYEAFNTSGGLGTLCDTLAGKVDNLDYKTIRYPGHCQLIRFLVNDLRLGKRRDVFKDVLEHAVPATTQDVVLIFVSASGMRDGQLMQETFTRKIYYQTAEGLDLAAIQLTTAASLCAMVDLHREGKLPATGFLRQEDVALDLFLANRFGRYYG